MRVAARLHRHARPLDGRHARQAHLRAHGARAAQGDEDPKAGTRYIPILKTTSTITRARSGRTVLRPTPGRRARRLLNRLRTAKANVLRVKVTFINRSGEAESRTERITLNVRR